MKKILLLLSMLSGFISFSFGQAPQSFNYQAVARDASNQLYQHTSLGVRISVLADGTSNTVAYSERHEVTTTDLGVFTLKIGEGTLLSGSFSAIDWGSAAYYLDVAIDPAGGTNYIPMGSSQLLSVPYALYANQAGDQDNEDEENIDHDNDSTNEIQTLVYDSLTQQLTITEGNTIRLFIPTDTSNFSPDNQNLILTGAILSIENGNAVDLSAIRDGVEDADADSTNELQQIGIFRDTLFLSKGGGAIPLPNLGFSIPFTDEVDLPNKIAFGIANTTTGNGIAIAGQQGVGSSLGLASSAAVFGTSEQGSGVVGFSSGKGNFAGVVGGTNDTTGTGVIGRADGLGRGGFFESTEGAALVTGLGNVGVGLDSPEVKLEVNGDLRVNADVGKFVLGYPDNGNQWAMTTLNDGATLLFGSKEDANPTFTPRFTMRQDGRIGIGTNQPAGQLEIVHNSTNIQPQLLLTENEADFARLSFRNSTVNNIRWNIDGLTAQPAGNAKLNFRFQNANQEVDHMTILGNGNVGIGNTDPDEELVIGDNISSNWAVPVINVGDETGGAVETGNDDYSISMTANNIIERARINANSPNGTGLGKLEIRTDGLSIGQSPGESVGYMMKLVHEGFGFNLGRNGTDFDWEMYVAQGNGELRFYFDGNFRGAFDPTSGLYTASDRRLKTNIQPMKTVLSAIMQLTPSSYQFIEGNPGQKTSLGFVAQDVENLFPELVSVSTDERSPGIYSLNYAGFGVLAIKAIQEQQALIETQQMEINNLKKRMDQLEALLKK